MTKQHSGCFKNNTEGLYQGQVIQMKLVFVMQGAMPLQPIWQLTVAFPGRLLWLGSMRKPSVCVALAKTSEYHPAVSTRIPSRMLAGLVHSYSIGIGSSNG